MVKPLTKLAVDIPQEKVGSRPDAGKETRSEAVPGQEPVNELAHSLPCVLYECNHALEILHVSSNVFELVGVWPKDLIGSRDQWEQRIPREDLKIVSDRLVDLETVGSASAIHRIIRESGLPIWVAHSWHRSKSRGIEIVRGCIVPVENEKRIQGVDPLVISRFVHKLGNQFQLLNLVINSLRKGLPDSRETEILQQAVEKSIELARAFSDFSQASTWMSVVDLGEILRAAYVTKRASFVEKGVGLDERLSASLGAISVYGDPFLLEVAVSNLLQNALEATEAGGKVELCAEVETHQNSAFVAKLAVIDSGCGVAENSRENVFTPFFTTKRDHEGLGLSMAARFIELHNGILKMTSAEGKGTRIEIILPAVHSQRHPDF